MSEAKLHILFRTCAVDNAPRRPPYFSKGLCARSLRLAMSDAPFDCDLTLVQDGPEPSEAVPLLRPLASETFTTEGLGNAGSWARTLEIVQARGDWSDEDLVYFVEDDYLHRKSALRRLGDAWELSGAIGYFTLYEHPNAYLRTTRGTKEFIYFAQGGHWRTITSTCMTFCARLSAIRRDLGLHLTAGSPDDKPLDYPLWLAIQGTWLERGLLRYYERIPSLMKMRSRALRLAKAHVIRHRTPRTSQLVAPMPSEATHLDLSDGLALGVDWEHVAMCVEQSP